MALNVTTRVSQRFSFPPPAAASTPAPHPHCFGDYELIEEIARGGMGIVYRARQRSLNRIVAVKVLLFGEFASDIFVKRFRAEAEAAASLQHPNIVAIHDVGECEGRHYFSMDYVPGRSLAELIQHKPLARERVARYVKIIAEAIHYAHEHGVLHRDLKPSNVLIDSCDQPRITDFGLAKKLAASSELTTHGQVLGSPNYMPPEQAEPSRGPVQPASDVYSLGAILYHLLTGRAPFQSETLEGTLRHVLETEPVAPRLLDSAIPCDLETICLKCLEKNPARRYATAQELAEELGRFLHAEPILARPANFAGKSWRWCRRQPALAGSVAALMLVFALGLIGVLDQWRQAERQRHLAEAKTELLRGFQYASDMNLALRRWEDGNRAQAFQLVEQHQPQGGTDLRGFEWRYLWRLCRGNYEFAFPRHDQIVGNIVFSPKGQWCATYAWNNTLRIWDAASRQKPLFTLTNASAPGAFTPDGAGFIAGRRDGTIVHYHLASHQSTALLTNAGELVALAADGRTMVTIRQSHLLEVWDLKDQRMIFRLPISVRRRMDYGWGSGVAVSPDGNLLAVVEQRDNPLRTDPAIQLWEVRTMKQRATLPVNRQIRILHFSPVSDILAAGDGNGEIFLWNAVTFEKRTFSAHVRPVLALAFSADGRALASGSSDETIKLWDVATLARKPKEFRGHLGAVWSLAFSPDGLRLASGARDASVKVWNLRDETTRDTITNLYSREWGNFTFSPDSKMIAAGCKDNTVRIWDAETLEEKHRVSGAAFAVAFAPSAKALLVSSRDEVPEWFDLETRTTKALPLYRGKIEDRVSCVDFSADRHTAALGFNDGSIQLFEIETGREIATFHAHDGGVGSVAFSPAGDVLVSGGRDKSVAVWDTHTRKKLRSSPEHRGSVCAVAVSADGRLLASGCNANTIKFWAAADMSKSLASMSYHESIIRSLSFSPDAKTLASGSEDNTVKLWSVASRLEVASFKFDDRVRLVAFSPDGNLLAVVTDSGALRLFRAVDSEEANR